MRIGVARHLFAHGTLRWPDDFCPQFPLVATVQLVDFKLDHLSPPGCRIARAIPFPLGKVKENILAIVLRLNKAILFVDVDMTNLTDSLADNQQGRIDRCWRIRVWHANVTVWQTG